MTVGDGSERCGEVGKWIDGIELARLDKGGDGRPVLRSRVMPGEERVLAIEGYWPNGSFDGIVVDLDATVGQEDAEPILVFCDIGQRFAERRLASDTGTMMREPGPHVGDQWH